MKATLTEEQRQVVEDFRQIQDLTSEFEYYVFYHYCGLRHDGQSHDEAVSALGERYHSLEEYQLRSAVDGILARIQSANRFLWDYLEKTDFDVTFVPIRQTGAWGHGRSTQTDQPDPREAAGFGPANRWTRWAWWLLLAAAFAALLSMCLNRPG